jgi:hypothetical protein
MGLIPIQLGNADPPGVEANARDSLQLPPIRGTVYSSQSREVPDPSPPRDNFDIGDLTEDLKAHMEPPIPIGGVDQLYPVRRAVGGDVDTQILREMSNRSGRFTDSESRKTQAASGSRKTTFETTEA